MKKLLLIIFVFIAQISFGQDLVLNGDSIYKAIATSNISVFNGGSTIWSVDSTLLLLKKQIDASDKLLIEAVKRFSECNCRKIKLKK